MSGAVVVTPSTGAAWATAWEQFEGIRKGMIALSLTNYDATTVPQIASGSWIEGAGSIYKWAANDTIIGTPSSNAINYITMVPSGAGASAILTPTWASGAPTWSDAYQGFYSGTTRYAGGCYYDGTNYVLKWIYTNRNFGPRSRELTLPLVMTEHDANTSALGHVITFNGSTGIGSDGPIAIFFPFRYLMTGLYTSCSAYSAGTVVLRLRYSGQDDNSNTEMAATTHTAIGNQSDTSITAPVIQDDRCYFIWVDPATSTNAIIDHIYISGYEVIRT